LDKVSDVIYCIVGVMFGHYTSRLKITEGPF